MNVDPKRVKKQVQAEAQCHKRWGAVKTWAFLLSEIFRNDIESAKEFMISDDGGFTEKEVERIVKENKRMQQSYNNKLIRRVEAF